MKLLIEKRQKKSLCACALDFGGRAMGLKIEPGKIEKEEEGRRKTYR